MPLYEYQCQECAETHEIVQRFSDVPQTICPSCGGALKKLISSPAIRFKGSGFYLTDYGKGTSPAASNAGSGESSSGSDAPGKSDSAKAEPARSEASSPNTDSTSKTDSSKADSSKSSAPSPSSSGTS